MRKHKPELIDAENPEWSAADFKKAVRFDQLPSGIKSVLTGREQVRGRGPQKAPTKKLVSIRLSAEVLEHFKATGDGWQTRIDDTLKISIARNR